MHFDAPRRLLAVLAATALILVGVGVLKSNLGGERGYILMATTTSTRDTGLLSVLLPAFQAASGLEVRYVAVGTGQALDAGRRGDVDLVMVHAPPLETEFLDHGYGACRTQVMFNRFVLVGPDDDAAGIAQVTSAVEALRRIAQTESRFESRADRSGTHTKELELWGLANLDPSTFGAWYERTNQGMGATLTIANERGAYTLSDDGTWFTLEDALPFLQLLYTTDESVLRNVYSVIPVNGTMHPNVAAERAAAFARWIIGSEAQRLIADYRINDHAIFTPDPIGGC